MSNNPIPVVETIFVPHNVKRELVGKYATKKAHDLLSAAPNLVPRSGILRALSEYAYVLSFQINAAYSFPEDLDFFSTDAGECAPLEQNVLAEGHKEGSSRGVKAGGAKR